MSWWETVRSGLGAIRAHRLRSALTVLGIVIGISSVILTVGLGQGAQREVADQIDALGSNLLIVSPGSSTDAGTGRRGGFGSASTLTGADATALTDPDAVPDAAAVAPATNGSVSLVNGDTNWTTSLVGTTPAWPQVRSRELSAGRFFTADEAARAADVVVIGADTASELFGPRSPVGQQVTVNGARLTVIGVLTASGSTATGTSEDDQAVVPLGTASRLTGSTADTVSTIYVEASSEKTLAAAYQEVQALLATRHGVTTADADFSIATQESLVETANQTNRTFTVLLGGVAGISLLVGGIGVMNIMLVSVTERVREIGLRKALGATPRAIRRQFLVEASLLGLTGGLVGVLIGVVGAQVLPHFIDQAVAVSLLATGAALATALALGVGFGVYPATRAARLTPIDALRSE
ncbi:ABC transporter permease [Pimelobacter simplex]|uniref:ABC transporter permease n=1 Tax=Nocardioides simplex TaxID=2045 RepID=UPI0021501982|nr:ABC transporter permease [Pimelobacter simplex]UUW89072.1 ABC transporter permease [Pimelobacter simplex]UUW98576.1 ABC transporter permease [Pimelobacter simplex]